MSVHEVERDELAAEKPEVVKTAQEEHMTYPCLLDTDGQWQKAAGIDAIPTFLVVNREGKIVHKFKGKLTEGSDSYKQIEAALDAALAAK